MVVKKLFRFSIDKLNGRFVNGWCFHRFKKSKAVKMTIVADGEVFGPFVCDRYRRDLKKVGLHPSGLCGFDFDFPDGFRPERFKTISFYVNDGKRPISEVSGASVVTLEPDSSANIFFMHIPKTAGSSFNAFLRQCYARSDYSDHAERFSHERRARLAGTRRCISGHLPWREARLLLQGHHYRRYSIIREPFSHLHSHLNYVRRVKTDVDQEVHYEYRHNDTIRALAERLMAIDFRDDGQLASFVDCLDGFEYDFFDNIQTRYFLDYRPEKVSREDCERAMDVVNHFELIGLTEYYDLYLNSFCDQMNLPLQAQTVRANISDSYELFGSCRKLEETPLDTLVQYDRMLYEYVKKRFWETVPATR